MDRAALEKIRERLRLSLAVDYGGVPAGALVLTILDALLAPDPRHTHVTDFKSVDVCAHDACRPATLHGQMGVTWPCRR